jgi:hypothetical protein
MRATCLRCPTVGHVARNCPNRPKKRPAEGPTGTLRTNTHIRFNSDDEQDSEAEDEGGKTGAKSGHAAHTSVSTGKCTRHHVHDEPVLIYLRKGTIPGMMSAKERCRIMRRAGTYVMEDNIFCKKPITKHPLGQVIPDFEERKRILDWAHKHTNHIGAAKLALEASGRAKLLVGKYAGRLRANLQGLQRLHPRGHRLPPATNRA